MSCKGWFQMETAKWFSVIWALLPRLAHAWGLADETGTSLLFTTRSFLDPLVLDTITTVMTFFCLFARNSIIFMLSWIRQSNFLTRKTLIQVLNKEVMEL